MSNYSTGICKNCGADEGLHQYETQHCPKNGKEENRYDHLNGKYYPQQWVSTVFEDDGLEKLHQAAPELLEACQRALEVLESENIFGQARLLLAVAIKKATS